MASTLIWVWKNTMNYEMEARTDTPDSNLASNSKFTIHVVFTTASATTTALRAARELASQMDARLVVLIPEVIPFSLPLNCPPVAPRFVEDKIRTLAEGLPDDLEVRILVCRDRAEALNRTLQPKSLILMCGRERRWLNADASLARTLRRNSHHVIFLPLK
jgi:hypothetical protein